MQQYNYEKACEDFDQDLRSGERPDPWDYCPPIEMTFEIGSDDFQERDLDGLQVE